VEIHRSARRHGIADDDIVHAIEHSLIVDDLGEDPDRWLVIGPDRAVIIHAMPLRPVYRKLLEP
jgi:hypothetical protein